MISRKLSRGPGDRRSGALSAISSGLAVLIVVFLAPGCQVTTTTIGNPRSTGTVAAPSAIRLHQIVEPLLIYYARYQELPPTLVALSTARVGTVPPLVDPESGKTYLFYRSGVDLPGRPGRVLVSSPATVEASVMNLPSRWVIMVSEPEKGNQLQAQVILVPEREIEAALGSPER